MGTGSSPDWAEAHDDDGPTVSIGIDLAWGPSAATGLCVASAGRVIESGSVRSDDEILACVARHLGYETVVAVDAPLVVTNATGQRRAEQLVGKLFGAAGASAHSSNLGMAAFSDGGRAARLAAALGLRVDPDGPLPAMVEVYPHPALVALFGLPRRLAYKARSGRSIDDRRVAFRALIRLLESLCGADPPLDVTTAPRWPQLTAAVESASTHAGLDRVEDELDAFVCAYVGLYWARWGRARSAVLGTVADGYIVTPVDPERAKCVIAMLPFPEPAAEEAEP